MKSKLMLAEKETKWAYPCMAKAKEGPLLVVLFIDEEIGTVVVSNHLSHRIGDYEENWVLSKFTPLPSGTQVILTQE